MSEQPPRRRPPLGDVQRAFYARREAKAETALEERRLKYLLSLFGLDNYKRGLLRACQERTGQPRLTFLDFAEMFPTFPVLFGTSRLGGVKLHQDVRALLPSLFTAFSRAPFIRYYDDFYEQVAGRAGTRAVALVFGRNRIQQGLALHNGGLDQYHVAGTTMVYTGGDKDHPVRLFLQPYSALLRAIHAGGHGWRPDGA